MENIQRQSTQKNKYTEDNRLARELNALEQNHSPDIAYLRLRIRPALETLIRQRRIHGLCRLHELELISPQLAGQYTVFASECQNAEAAALLYQLASRTAQTSPSPLPESGYRPLPARQPMLPEGSRRTALARRVLEQCQKELSLAFPGLTPAFCSFSLRPDRRISLMGTDGQTLYYQPDAVLNAYRRDPAAVNRLLFHTAIHCLLHHPRLCPPSDTVYSMRCDEAAENLLDEISLPCILPCCQSLRDDHLLWQSGASGTSGNFVSPDCSQEGACSSDGSGSTPADSCTPEESPVHPPRLIPEQTEVLLRRRLAEYARNGRQHRPRAGQGAGNGLTMLTPKPPPFYDYGTLLRLWAVTGEERTLDPENFDLISYTFGLSHYGNIPLLEPLETRLVHKIRELVIALDTSGSCSGERIQRFLDETWAILENDSWFFDQMNLHVIQCDSMIQADRKLCSREELKQYSQEITVQGFGGTDFRPVFTYVNELIRKKEFEHLAGIIYFTDGQGIFPENSPSVETAFVLTGEDAENTLLPDWAIRVRLPASLRTTSDR